MKFGFDHPMFKPLWVRIAVVAVAGLWGLFELSTGAYLWALIFLALAGVAFHGLFIAYEPPETDRD
ncbi:MULTISPECIES: DUF3329 domain-containing protein [unclassified Roseitalea]|uniref:DUF3329 domain-containing protein n=1 Tax=unclassified Roseitalea TaxID=2639107 RepID=UPI00273D0FF1|nr:MULTISPECIES: DUF3329 domain-containing protein [unclassified Roseitalea]